MDYENDSVGGLRHGPHRDPQRDYADGEPAGSSGSDAAAAVEARRPGEAECGPRYSVFASGHAVVYGGE